MCITFIHVNSNIHAGPYRLILIANRDEFYDRKSKTCHFWDDNPDVLGGQDLTVEPHGTWLAASKKGKIGVLLNIQEEKNSPKGVESRGVLVSNYVKRDTRASDYIRDLCCSTKIYNGYHLLLFTLKAKLTEVLTLTNLEYGRNTKVTEQIDGFHGFSNASIDNPYQKVLYGREEFEKIVKQYHSLEQKEMLVSELIKLLKSSIRHYPDDVLFESKKNLMSLPLIEKLSSIFVSIPEINYGTRTHTLILIDWDNKMDYREYTMSEEHTNPETAQWNYKKYEVSLDIES